jgi:hypothetical protein
VEERLIFKLRNERKGNVFMELMWRKLYLSPIEIITPLSDPSNPRLNKEIKSVTYTQRLRRFANRYHAKSREIIPCVVEL